VIDIEVQPHADCIGGHQIFDVAGLIERDLRIARSRRQRPEHNRGTASLAADQFGDRIDLFRRESDDRSALRQPGDLLRAGIEELRQTRPLDDCNARQQVLEDRPHGRCAEKQGFASAAQMHQPVGEDVAALQIAGELHLVDRDERRLGLARHGLDGADREASHMRRDLFLAGDQRDIVGTDLLDDTGIDLAGKQPERQPDHAGFVRDHALDRIMRLAGIGGAEDPDHTAAAQDHGLVRHYLDPAHFQSAKAIHGGKAVQPAQHTCPCSVTNARAL
jgi:hypothetical protein